MHKPRTPLRPIVDYTGSIGYATSRSLADILGPLIGNTEHHLNNSAQLAEDLSEVMIEEDDMFISHDVVSLFTKYTPIDKALEVIRDRLAEDKTLKKRTLLSVDDIMELLKFILTTTYFTFKGQIYQQLFFFFLGSPVSPIVANFFMEFLEQSAIATAPIECQPSLWKGYVDDILEIIRKGSADKLTDHLNQVDRTGNIKFTYETEEEGKIPFFIPTLIIRKADGSVKLLVYKKKTHTNQYLNFQSHHPLHHKLGVIRTLLDRADRIVTEQEDRAKAEEHIKQALSKCGYPDWSLRESNSSAPTKPLNRNQRRTRTIQNLGVW
ncbi:uncharacterized protein [Amphiura filiformis]|uniref:uncharacterized protein n=1 Tax=Amphiura filiformis TaxID=82378 RepID=UPI003B2218E1